MENVILLQQKEDQGPDSDSSDNSSVCNHLPLKIKK